MTTNSSIHDNTAKRAESESFNASAFSISLTVKDLAGNARISINQDDGAKGWTRIKGEGFSLNITTEQNIDKIANRIKELGGILDTEPADMPWGARAFRLKDPDGYKLAISSPRPA
jgi:uncharacterized glyoxalase superfamily protein PhnB